MSRNLRTRELLAILLVMAAWHESCAAALEPSMPVDTDLGNGVHQFMTPDVVGNVVGNSVAIITDRDVLIFDTTLLPSTARNLLTALHQVTDKPVRYAVDSHWHPDHSGGNDTLLKAYPDVEIIASQETRDLMRDTGAVYIKTLEFETAQTDKEIRSALKSGRGPDGKALSAQDRQELQTQLSGEQQFLADYRANPIRLPTVVFGKSMTLIHGGREFRLLRLPGHTAGDVALYLPSERILLAGDLLAYPVPFCADSHPSAWIESLRALVQLDATIIVPGHGQAQHDASYLHLVLDSLLDIQVQVRQALQRGLTLEQAQKQITLDAIRLKFTHDDAELNGVFAGNFLPIIRQMYDEATEGLEQYQ